MLNLTDKEWGAFLLTDLFVINPGKRLTKSAMKAGKRPFIGATEYENGITNWVSNSNASLDRNVLGVNYNGSVMETFYHPYECIFSDDVKRFRLKFSQGNRYIYLFLKTSIVQQKPKYAYGYKFNENRINRQSILLPITADGFPDWEFMEEYIHEREAALIERYCESVPIPDVENDALSLTDKEWGEFTLSSVFSISSTSSGIDKTKLIGKKGRYPYVTRSDINNGVNDFIDAQPLRPIDDGNCITIGLDTQTAFYQPFAFYTGQNIQILRNERLNKSIAMFVLPLIKQLTNVFSWGGNGATLARLKRSKIMLPITKQGDPDWDYMDKYAKDAANRQYAKYLEYIKNSK